MMFNRNTYSTYGEYEVSTEHWFILESFLIFDSILHMFVLYWFFKYIIKEHRSLKECVQGVLESMNGEE